MTELTIDEDDYVSADWFHNLYDKASENLNDLIAKIQSLAICKVFSEEYQGTIGSKIRSLAPYVILGLSSKYLAIRLVASAVALCGIFCLVFDTWAIKSLNRLPSDLPYQGHYFSMSEIEERGEFIELRDGSLWRFAQEDQGKLRQWLLDDQLSVCMFPFVKVGHLQFYLFNHRTKNGIKLTLESAAPKENLNALSPYRIQQGRVLTLSDGSQWLIGNFPYYYVYQVKYWESDDRVTILTNSQYFDRNASILFNQTRGSIVVVYPIEI